MKLQKLFLAATFAASFAISSQALARPEYAVKQNTSCTSCHVSPWGGGPRNVYGKIFGSRTFGMAKYSTQDLISANIRGIAYYPKKPTQSKNGLALMEASVSGNAAIIEEKEGTGELRTVLTYNMAPLGSGPREAYFRWKTPGQIASPLPTYLTVGRFNAPFGLLTDEHRTYSRIQTNMTLNNYEMGIAASGSIIPGLTYDLAVVNDFQSGGLFTTKDLTWGTILNVRWMPTFVPFYLGASQNYQRTLIQPTPYATSLYTAISLDRLTNNAISGSILAERVFAHNWDNAAVNPGLGTMFVPTTDASYQNAINTSPSAGYLVQVKWDLNPRWTLFYKFDYLALDTNFPADAYSRHGVGVELFLSSNLILNTRVERAFVGRPELVGTNALAAQDAFLAMLRMWL